MENSRPLRPHSLCLLLALAAGLFAALPTGAHVTTYAVPGGSTTAGGISVDEQGNVYSADFGGTQIFRIAPDGSVSVFANGLNTPSGNKGKAKLSWTHDSLNREGFAIELSTAGSAFEEIGTVGPRARKATIRGLEAGETYRVRVVTFNGSGSSKPSKKAKIVGR